MGRDQIQIQNNFPKITISTSKHNLLTVTTPLPPRDLSVLPEPSLSKSTCAVFN